MTAVARQANLPRLREVITAGESLRITDEITAFFQSLDGCTLCNQYGPTRESCCHGL